jgi:hypothetical protein
VGWCPEGHCHCLSGGTATPRAVPTRLRPRVAVGDSVTAMSGVHRHGVSGAPSWHRLFLAENKGRQEGHRHGHCPGDGAAPP